MQPIIYTRESPYFSAITERYTLCKGEGGGKTTYHIALDISDSGLHYAVGDSVAILAENPTEHVSSIIKFLRGNSGAIVVDRQGGSHTLIEFLTNKANIAHIPRKVVAAVAAEQVNPEKKALLNALLAPGSEGELKQYCSQRQLWDFLKEHNEVSLSPQQLCSFLQPLLPRFYSIASSPKIFPEQIHLTVSLLEYTSRDFLRRGVCTGYLWYDAPLDARVIPIYIQPHKDFTLPGDEGASIIMVGPGTGVAPFRAFMQERMMSGAPGKSWLFFGERYRAYNCFYEGFWQELEERNLLRIDYAFSRDQEEKIYVQHRLLEKGRDVFDWLESGAYFYVCGDAHHMAKDVDKALHLIIQEHGGCDEQGAKSYVKELRHAKRYLRDVY